MTLHQLSSEMSRIATDYYLVVVLFEFTFYIAVAYSREFTSLRRNISSQKRKFTIKIIKNSI